MFPNISSIIQNLLELQQAYAFTYRSVVTKERYRQLITSGLITNFTFSSEFIREPLIEHVGHLPIIAVYLHRFIKHKAEVDLGRALTMLAVHDIGETQVGDVLTYAKTDSQANRERQAAESLLCDDLQVYLGEFEQGETFDAKYAKSVDSIAPLLHEMVLPQVTLERFKYHNFGIDDILSKKQKHFAWDSVLAEIFKQLIQRIRQMKAEKS